MAGTLLNPRRKEKHSEDKQMAVAAGPSSLPVPIQNKARSASVLSTASNCEGSDTVLRNTIRDFFHIELSKSFVCMWRAVTHCPIENVKVTISSNAFPWKALDKTLVSQGGIILNYPNDVPFPNLSSDPTYNGPPCKPEGRNGTGIRKIGIAAMRRLAQRCNNDEGGLRFIGGYNKKAIETCAVPWIVGCVPPDATSPIRCLYYNGTAALVDRQTLPAEWLALVKQESPPTPKPLNAASNEPTRLNRDPSPIRSRSSTPTPRGVQSLGASSKHLSLRSPTPWLETSPARSPLPARSPSPILQDSQQLPPAPVHTKDTTPSPKPVSPFANLHSEPRARMVSAQPKAPATIEEPSNLLKEPCPPSGGDVSSYPSYSRDTTPSSPNVTSSKRALEDTDSDSLSAKRLRSITPSLVAGPPAPSEPVSADNPPSSQASPVVTTIPPVPHSTTPSGQDISGDDTNNQQGLYTSAAHILPPTIPVGASHASSDQANMQSPPSVYHNPYPSSWQTGYGGYGGYYYPPPPQWGYTDPRPRVYQQEPPRDGMASGPTSAPHSNPANPHPFQTPDGMGVHPHQLAHPPPPFYGRHDGAVYPPPFNPRFGSVPPSGYEQYGQMVAPHAGMPPPGHSQMPPPHMPPPSQSQMPPSG
jgi:hypothetical protein